MEAHSPQKNADRDAASLPEAMVERLISGPATSAREVFARIEALIRSGELAPGTRIPTERRMAEMVGLSRSTVRSAFDKLFYNQLVSRTVGSGTFVSEAADHTSFEQRENVFAVTSTPRQLLEFRIFIEPQLAEHLVLSASDSTLAAISEFVVESRTANDWRSTEHADAEFHRRLLCATGNPMLTSVADLMGNARQAPSWQLLKERRFDIKRWRRYQREHEAIMIALRNRDSELASKLMSGHLSGVTERFLIETPRHSPTPTPNVPMTENN